MMFSSRLLQKQMRHLWQSGQWQQVLQLLPQGGGQVLLQGLTLVLQIMSLDAALVARAESLGTLSDLLCVLADLDTGVIPNTPWLYTLYKTQQVTRWQLCC
jgi:hypothetical protein